MSSNALSTDNATVVIQINPRIKQKSVTFNDGQEAQGNVPLKRCIKVQSKSLGTVQIMIGVMMFLFGILLTINDDDFDIVSVHSGITRWGSLIYISAGSLWVGAENKHHLFMVKASLGMNVLSAITAGIAIILMSIDITTEYLFHQICVQIQDYNDISYIYDVNQTCSNFEPKTETCGIFGILLVFLILQFIISVCISAFACKATCNTDSTEISSI